MASVVGDQAISVNFPLLYMQIHASFTKRGNIKVIKLGFSGALKMANEERELSVSAQCKLGG